MVVFYTLHVPLLPLALAPQGSFLGALFLRGFAMASGVGGGAGQIRFEAGEPLLGQALIQHVGWAELAKPNVYREALTYFYSTADQLVIPV